LSAVERRASRSPRLDDRGFLSRAPPWVSRGFVYDAI